MADLVKHLSGNRIIGDLIAREKYSFVDGKLIASIVDDVMAIVKEAAAGQGESPVTSANTQSTSAAQIADKISLCLGKITAFNVGEVVNEVSDYCRQLRAL